MRILFIILISLNFLNAQERLLLRIDTNEILIGQPVKLNLSLTSGKSYQWINYDLNKEVNYFQENIEIVEVSNIDTSFNNDLPTYTQSVILTSFDTGYYVINPIVLKSKSSEDSLSSNPLLLRVSYPEFDQSKGTDLADINGQIEKPFKLSELLYYWWTMLIPLFIYLLYKGIMKYKNRPTKEVEVIKPIKAAHEIALEKLKQIQKDELWNKETTKVYLSWISTILREYIEDRFEVLAMEETSFELIESIHEKVSDDIKEDLKSLLESFDMAKFAKSEYANDENKLLLDSTINWVEQTKLVNEN